MNVLSALSRVAIGAPFVWMGYEAAKEPGRRVDVAADFGIPEDLAEASVRLNGAVMVAGGLAVATGVLPRLGALAVTGAMVPTTLAGHAFWKKDEPLARRLDRIQFLKNVGMVGGLLAVAATPNPRRTGRR